MVILRISKGLEGTTIIDAIPHDVEGPTISYTTADNKNFRNCASGITQENSTMRALVEKWNGDFCKDRFGRTV
jgi:hypothetical protein